MRVSCAAHSRTCATEPGAEVSWSEYSVWIESMTQKSGASASQRGEDLLELDLGQHAHPSAVQAEPARAQRHLRAAFLAGDVEHLHLPPTALSGRLQQQRALADAGVAADQHHAAADDAAAEHAVELVLAGGRARHLGDVDLAERGHRLRAARATGSGACRRRGLGDALPRSVFQAPQCGHLPSHLGLLPPHSLQV